MHSSERWCVEELLSESRAFCRFHSISSDSRGLHCDWPFYHHVSDIEEMVIIQNDLVTLFHLF